MRTAFSTVVRESQDLACGVFDARGTHDRPVADRHAGPHQRHGDRRAPLPGRLPARHARAGRRADHQRPLDDRRPDQRHHRRSRRSSATAAWSRYFANLCHSRRHRRAQSSPPRRARSTRKGCAIPIMKLFDARRAERRAAADHPRQRAHAGRDDRRPLRAGRLQRRRRARRCCRSWTSSGSRASTRCRTRSSPAPSRRCATRSARCPTASTRNEAWSDGFEEPITSCVHADRRAATRSASTSPARRRRAAGHQRRAELHPRLRLFAIKAAICPDVPHNEGAFRPVHVTAPPGSILNCAGPGGGRGAPPDRPLPAERHLRRAGPGACRAG